MEQNLQTAIDLINKNDHLSEDEKAALVAKLKEADKKITVTEFKLQRSEKAKRTTTILLEETIEELEKKRKDVEAQNHELAIEASLERARAVAMSMMKPDDLLNISKALFTELQLLGFDNVRNAIIHTYNDQENYFDDYDYSDFTKGNISHIPYIGNTILEKFIQEIRKGKDAFTEIVITGEDLKEWQSFRAANNEVTDARLKNMPALFYYIYSVGEASIGISAFSTLPADKQDVLKRFRNVFDLAYRRYVDITYAAAQAKEAQIQLALERVRARTMAMQRSDELTEAASLLFQQVQLLGLPVISCGFNIWQKEDKFCNAYMSDEAGYIQPPFKIPLTASPVFIHFAESRQKGESFYAEEVSGKTLEAHYKYMLTLPVFSEIANNFLKAGFNFPEFQINNVANFRYGNLIFITNEPVPEAQEIFQRFGKVFEQTYTRFLDLQKAEAQVRGAKIEAALEKVRSRSLAMHKSDELKEVATVVFQKLQELNIVVDGGVTISIYTEGSRDQVQWVAAPDLITSTRFRLPYSDDKIIADHLAAKESGTEFFSRTYTFEEKNNMLKYLFEHTDFKQLPDELKNWLFQTESYSQSIAFSKNSSIFINSYSGKLLSENETDILKRFSRVFEQAYIRFLDLQKAEVQTREAQIEASLERVRSRTLAMQKSNELAETSAVLFRQLISLGIEPNRLYISIMKDDEGETEFWITDEDGSKVSSAYTDNLNANTSFKKMYEGWKAGKQSILIDMQGKELQEYFQHLTSLGIPFKDGLMQKRRIQHLAFFNRGFIGMAAPDDQSEETIHLLERFAAVFNLTFTRFNDLKIVEAQALQSEQDLIEIKAARKKAEEALSELQVTQNQLIQKEKMASLGELTAGIAHEIQNPLNFVNNFSEVSKELLVEMRAALESGDKDTAEEIANDIIQNLEKINHHGKRADAIVKGMLQHSRQPTGTKEPTDINALCDEFLRLSYHGLRAKDKNFNADFKTDFDESIGKIDIVPQEVGRVLLNLFNNAFYAVKEKLTAGLSQPAMDYKPLVSVQTKKINDKIEVSVKDNGNGIPQNIVDKIFQPFFTTKPTGEGTGLGLSLSYDIIKAHGGEIKAGSKQGEGTTFTIVLPTTRF